VALAAFCVLTACSGGGATGAASPARSSPSSPSIASPSTTLNPSPADEPLTTRLNCGRPVTATHGLALYSLPISPPMLEVLDISNPLKPALLCTLGPAQGGHFDQVHNQLLFFIGDQMGMADLTSGTVVQTQRLPVPAFQGAFSRDGATFAYRSSDAAGSISTHLNSGGYDRTLYTQEPIGGHGGPAAGQGPVNELEFSPDGAELLDYDTFRPPSGPDKFLVYRIAGILGTYAPPDSFLIFHANGAHAGAWSSSGTTLYLFISRAPELIGDVDSLDGAGRTQTVASGLNGFYWPRTVPGGKSIVYDAYVQRPGDSCGGLPHLWRLEPDTRATAQLSTAISSEAVFVSQTVLWSNDEMPTQCGPGGESAPHGVIVAHDLRTGSDARVDMTATVPGIGGASLPPPDTLWVVDVLL